MPGTVLKALHPPFHFILITTVQAEDCRSWLQMRKLKLCEGGTCFLLPALTWKGPPGRDTNEFISKKATPMAQPGLWAMFKPELPGLCPGAANRPSGSPFPGAFCLRKCNFTSGSSHPQPELDITQLFTERASWPWPSLPGIRL